jgi:hypothetical protein
MSNLEAYQENMSEYRRLRASKHYGPAMTALDAAITTCPCDEALPTLAAWREELEPLTRPVPVWKQWLGWQG